MKKILVFCGSASGLNPVFAESATRLGRLLAENGFDLIYGGGASGLMGAVSQAAALAGAHVVGIVPKAFVKASGEMVTLSANLQEHVVEDLMTRKTRMILDADAAIALPGGFGTLDEIFEVIEAQEIKIYDAPDTIVQPMIVVNINGYFDGTIAQIKHGIAQGFIRPQRERLITFVGSVEEAIGLLNDYKTRPPVAARTYL